MIATKMSWFDFDNDFDFEHVEEASWINWWRRLRSIPVH